MELDEDEDELGGGEVEDWDQESADGEELQVDVVEVEVVVGVVDVVDGVCWVVVGGVHAGVVDVVVVVGEDWSSPTKSQVP
jgi:hypothetical protein